MHGIYYVARDISTILVMFAAIWFILELMFSDPRHPEDPGHLKASLITLGISSILLAITALAVRFLGA